MKIEIKLDNPKSCKGCILLKKLFNNNEDWFCRKYNHYWTSEHCDRPQICIDENGE